MTTYEQELSAYHLLKAATSQYGRMPEQLQGDEIIRAERIAAKAQDIEALVLSSHEARAIGPTDTAVDQAYDEMRSRYDDEVAFQGALKVSGLTPEGIRVAIRREIWATQVMDSVGARAEAVSGAEIAEFFDSNRDKFSIDETRIVRHVLVTINDDYEENTPEAALMRITEARARLASGEDFAAIAKQYSECPTAVEGGLLGRAPKGKLYPEIDAILFTMKKGEISQPIQTDMGYHLILCEDILKPEDANLDEAKDRIQVYLESKKQQQAQRQWLAGLTQKTQGD